MSTETIHSLEDGEAKTVLDHLTKIKHLAESLALDGSSTGFQIYRAARDALEIVAYDAVGRNALKALRSTGDREFRGYAVSDTVLNWMQQDKKINAIKEFRYESGLGLKEAKDWVEAYMQHYGIGQSPF